MASRTAYSTWTPQKPTLFDGHYLRNRSTLDIGVLGYIRIVQHKEHSPEVLSIPPGTLYIGNYVHFKHTSILYSLLLTLHTTGFNLQKFYVLHTQWICVVYVGLRTDGYYFLVQHWPTGCCNRHEVCNFSLPPRIRWILDTWPLKYGTDRLSRNVVKELQLLAALTSQMSADPEMECVYCAVETKSLATVQFKVGFVVCIRAYSQVSEQVLRFSPVSIVPPMIHVHASITDAV